VTASPQLSPVATYEGEIVGRNIVDGPKHTPDYAAIPACVSTIPVLASVGLTEAQAKEKGLAIRVMAQDMRDWLSAKTYAETRAWAKILVENGSERIVGTHIVGHGGEELINLIGLAMAHGIAAGDLKAFMFAYPTFSADLKSLL
jgi:glutathione reductase (NADPH)